MATSVGLGAKSKGCGACEAGSQQDEEGMGPMGVEDTGVELAFNGQRAEATAPERRLRKSRQGRDSLSAGGQDMVSGGQGHRAAGDGAGPSLCTEKSPTRPPVYTVASRWIRQQQGMPEGKQVLGRR